MRRTGRGVIVQLGVKELRSVWHDKVLLVFMLWAFSFGIYSAATAVSRELRRRHFPEERLRAHLEDARHRLGTTPESLRLAEM